jgi:hypothetical protein
MALVGHLKEGKMMREAARLVGRTDGAAGMRLVSIVVRTARRDRLPIGTAGRRLGLPSTMAAWVDRQVQAMKTPGVVQAWTRDDSDGLRALIRAGEPPEVIEHKIGRTQDAVFRQVREWESIMSNPGVYGDYVKRHALVGVDHASLLDWLAKHGRESKRRLPTGGGAPVVPAPKKRPVEKGPTGTAAVTAGKPWTDDEDRKLVDELGAGMSYAGAGAAHGRTVGAITSRLRRIASSLMDKEGLGREAALARLHLPATFGVGR